MYVCICTYIRARYLRTARWTPARPRPRTGCARPGPAPEHTYKRTNKRACRIDIFVYVHTYMHAYVLTYRGDACIMGSAPSLHTGGRARVCTCMMGSASSPRAPVYSAISACMPPPRAICTLRLVLVFVSPRCVDRDKGASCSCIVGRAKVSMLVHRASPRPRSLITQVRVRSRLASYSQGLASHGGHTG